MKLDGQEFDVPKHNVEEFFSVLDGFEKVILSKDAATEKVTQEQYDTFCVYEVSNHALGLPKEAKELLKPLITYL